MKVCRVVLYAAITAGLALMAWQVVVLLRDLSTRGPRGSQPYRLGSTE